MNELYGVVVSVGEPYAVTVGSVWLGPIDDVQNHL